MYFAPEIYESDDQLAKAILAEKERAKGAMAMQLNEIWPGGYLMFLNRHDPRWFRKTVDAVFAGGRDHPFAAAVDKALFKPIPFQQVEAITPDICDAVVPGPSVARCKPAIADLAREARDPIWAAAELVGHLINNQLFTEIDIEAQEPSIVRSGFIYGSAVQRLEWVKQIGPEWKQVRKGKGGAYEFKKTNDDATIYEGVRGPLVEPWNFFPDPDGQSVNGEDQSRPCGFTCEQCDMRVDTLIAWILGTKLAGWKVDEKVWRAAPGKRWDLLREFFKDMLTARSASAEWLRQQQEKLGRASSSSGEAAGKGRNVPLLRYYEGGTDPRFILLAGEGQHGKILLHRHEDHPARNAGIPYVLFKPVPIPYEFWGLSLVEAIAGITHQANTLVNIRISDLVRGVNGITLVDAHSQLTPDMLLSQPGGIVMHAGRVPPERAVHHIDWPDRTATVHREVDELRGDATQAFGGIDPMVGLSGGQTANTARGFGYSIDRGSRRWDLMRKALGRQHAQQCNIILALDQQYITAERFVEIAGKEGAAAWESLKVEDIGRKWRFFFDTRPVVTNHALRLQHLFNYGQLDGQWEEFNRKRHIVEVARAMELDRPMDWATGPDNDAELENLIFLRTGYYHNPDPRDDHGSHRQTHDSIGAEAKAKGAEAEANHQQHCYLHEQMEMQMAAGGPPGGAQGGAPGARAPMEAGYGAERR